MCGRYASSSPTDQIIDDFAISEIDDPDVLPSWNVAPTQRVRAVLERPADEGAPAARRLRALRWGLVPHWAHDRSVGSRMINARVETVLDKPAFRAAVRRRRCLLPATGYYEWRRTPGSRVPHFIASADGGPLALAALYERWREPAAEGEPERWLHTCAVLTRPAAGALADIHQRTPVVVPRHLRDDWLDCSSPDRDTARSLLAGIPEASLVFHPVSTDVNRVANNAPHLAEPAPAPSAPRPDADQLSLF